LVKQGDIVAKGQIIALVGSTGLSTAPHLHYEIRKDGTQVNPMDYISNVQ
jgi:murein DD-endopeptidase MepM/ murein hydrolase activator NlpD